MDVKQIFHEHFRFVFVCMNFFEIKFDVLIPIYQFDFKKNFATILFVEFIYYFFSIAVSLAEVLGKFTHD